jgi:hypothetical protein
VSEPKQKLLAVYLTSTSPVEVGKPDHAHGWGEDAQEVRVVGEVAQIMVRRGSEDESCFSIRITPEGHLIITAYNTTFSLSAPNNMWMHNDRPWKDEKKGKK